jgi:hypothetical protein
MSLRRASSRSPTGPGLTANVTTVMGGAATDLALPILTAGMVICFSPALGMRAAATRGPRSVTLLDA